MCLHIWESNPNPKPGVLRRADTLRLWILGRFMSLGRALKPFEPLKAKER